MGALHPAYPRNKTILILMLSLAGMLALVAPLAITRHAFASEPQVVKFGVPALGTRVIWQRTENGRTEQFTTEFSQEVFDGTPAYCWKNFEKNIASVFDMATMNWKGDWSYDLGGWLSQAKPHNGEKHFPLKAGKSYEASYHFWERDGWTGEVTTEVTIYPAEKVAVPAGTFTAVKIVQKNAYYSYTDWYSPELNMSVRILYENPEASKRIDEVMAVNFPYS